MTAQANMNTNTNYDVAKGVILAHKYEEKRIAKTIADRGVYVSEKLDGIRAIWDGQKMLSRQNKPIHAPSWFIENFPKNIPLDGELFLGKGRFNDTSSVVRKKKPVDSEWEQIKFMVFDVPSSGDMGFEDRIAMIDSVIDHEKIPHLIKVGHEHVKSFEKINELYNAFVKDGAEGVMIRQPASKYSPKRTFDLMKYKPVDDMEVIVYDHADGTGKYKGMLGALMVRRMDDQSVTFKVGTGLNDELRKTYAESIPIGCKITIQFGEINQKTKVPRFPVFVGVRSVD